ncbi:MAG TPA: glycosyltransferase family 4 protein [Methylophilaceae bacterium]|nr:glycosyltransferase family 4 protein [Methylophilaceae bacterium]
MAFLSTIIVLLALLKTPLSGLVLDKPNHRSLHNKQIPRTGGVAILSGIFISWSFVGQFNTWIFLLLSLLAISFIDDIFDISAVVRLFTQVIVAGVFVLHFREVGGLALTLIFLLVWMTNLYNFMDGADGLAGGMTLFGFSAYTVAAYVAHDPQIALISGCVASASFAFLIFNFHPAKIFMGDSGSIPLGFLAGAIGIYGWEHAIWPWWFPVLVFSPFIVDATVTLIKRLFKGEKIWQAHRSHYYQKLVQAGLGHRKTAVYEYVLMVACALTALCLQSQPTQTVWLVLISWIVIYFLLIHQINKRWSKV